MKIVALDALLWDIFDDGTKKIGGAGSNFIFHLSHLGADATIISAIGDDDLGKDLKAILEQNHIDHYLQIVDYPTSTVNANVGPDGVPNWQIHEDVAWDNIEYDQKIKELAQDADLIYFGTLPQRNPKTRKTIQQMVTDKKSGAKTFVDVNIRQHYYDKESLEFCLNNADYLKISDEEMPIVAKTLGLPENPDDFYNAIKDKVEMFIYTQGGKGSTIYRGNEKSHHNGFKVALKDTVGAGDSFSATACSLALNGADLDVINHFANAVAAYVCSNEGAMHPVPFKVF